MILSPAIALLASVGIQVPPVTLVALPERRLEQVCGHRWAAACATRNTIFVSGWRVKLWREGQDGVTQLHELVHIAAGHYDSDLSEHDAEGVAEAVARDPVLRRRWVKRYGVGSMGIAAEPYNQYVSDVRRASAAACRVRRWTHPCARRWVLAQATRRTR